MPESNRSGQSRETVRREKTRIEPLGSIAIVKSTPEVLSAALIAAVRTTFGPGESSTTSRRAGFLTSQGSKVVPLGMVAFVEEAARTAGHAIEYVPGGEGLPLADMDPSYLRLVQGTDLPLFNSINDNPRGIIELPSWPALIRAYDLLRGAYHRSPLTTVYVRPEDLRRIDPYELSKGLESFRSNHLSWAYPDHKDGTPTSTGLVARAMASEVLVMIDLAATALPPRSTFLSLCIPHTRVYTLMVKGRHITPEQKRRLLVGVGPYIHRQPETPEARSKVVVYVCLGHGGVIHTTLGDTEYQNGVAGAVRTGDVGALLRMHDMGPDAALSERMTRGPSLKICALVRPEDWDQAKRVFQGWTFVDQGPFPEVMDRVVFRLEAALGMPHIDTDVLIVTGNRFTPTHGFPPRAEVAEKVWILDVSKCLFYRGAVPPQTANDSTYGCLRFQQRYQVFYLSFWDSEKWRVKQ